MRTMQYFATIGTVLGNVRYAVITIFSACALMSLYWFVTMPNFLEHFDVMFAENPFLMVCRIMLIVSIAAIGGTNISLVVYKFRHPGISCCSGMRKTGSGLFGGVLSVFTPGCPACTSILSVALGFAGGIAALPFGGSELGLVSLCAVIFSMFWITKDIRKSMKIDC